MQLSLCGSVATAAIEWAKALLAAPDAEMARLSADLLTIVFLTISVVAAFSGH